MSSLYEQELDKANQFRMERELQEAEQATTQESQANALPIIIGNSVIAVVMAACIIYLLGGAFLNARRELKGQKKKKRTSMIIFVCAIMAICYAVFYVINPR